MPIVGAPLAHAPVRCAGRLVGFGGAFRPSFHRSRGALGAVGITPPVEALAIDLS